VFLLYRVLFLPPCAY